MSLIGRSLSLSSSSCGISHLSLGFKHRGVAGAWLKTPSRSQLVLRVANVVRSEGNGEVESSVASNPSPSGVLEVSSADIASVALNQVAPPVGNVFGSAAKEVTVLEDPLGFFKNRLEKKAQKVKQAFESVEEAVAPTPYSPAQGNDVVTFFCITVFLILAFWLGNYVVPTWIFKETVFRNSGGKGDDIEDYVPDEKPSEEEVDPADLIVLPPNLMPFREAAVTGFKAGRQKARDAEKRKKKAGKGK